MANSHIPAAPASWRGADADVYHGVTIDDPYRWLEDGSDPQVVQWVAAHNNRTRQALDAQPSRGWWHERLSALVALPTVMSVQARGRRLFVVERPANADQFVLMMRSTDDVAAPPILVLDPADRVGDGAAAIDWFQVSADGRLVAYGISEGGTEDSTLRVLCIGDDDTVTHLVDEIYNTRAASVAWAPDSLGFWYTRYPHDDQYNRHVRFHLIGADPATDAVVFDSLPRPEAWADVQVSDDGRYLLVSLEVGWGRTDAHLLDNSSGQWQVVCQGVEARTAFEFWDHQLVAVTTREAPNGRVVLIDCANPQQWVTIVHQQPGVVLGAHAVCAEQVLVVASANAVDSVQRWTMSGQVAGPPIDLGIAAVQQLTADAATAWITVAAFERPTATYRFGAQQAVQLWCPATFDDSVLPQLSVTHHQYPSLDGTHIGLFVVHRADLPPTVDTPMILTGYGGFAIAESPIFMPNLAAWCGVGGAYAIAGLRGGIEHGEAWHHAGRRGQKQNVFDDFHAAADWLVATGRTSRSRLAIAGGSNGGLLVGAALTQRPDLCAAVWCAVPLLDMVRFPKFLIARLWTDEYGDPDIADEFAWLHAYSPYHHVTQGVDYPALLLTTAEGDSRVDPLHARKMTALMNWASASQQQRPVLLYQAGRAGHGVGKPASMRIDEGADVLSFLSWQLNVEHPAT